MFGNKLQLMRNRRSVLAIIVVALVLMAFTSLLVMASSSYDLYGMEGWGPCKYNNLRFPGEAPFYWLEKKVPESSIPKIEFTYYLPGSNVLQFRFEGSKKMVSDVINYGETKIFELPPGNYEFKIIETSTSITIKEGYNYKFIMAPKDENGNLVDPSTLPPSEYG